MTQYKIIGGDGQEYGPVSADDLRRWIAEGRANAQTRVQAEGSTDWRPLSDFPEFGLATVPPGLTPLPTGIKTMPTFMKVFAILSMVFGGLGLLCSPVAFIGIPASLRMLGDGPLLRAWLVFSAVWGVVGAIALLSSGIGLWQRKAWARKLAVVYAVLAIVLGLFGMVVMFVSFGSNSSVPAPQKIGGMMGGILGGLVGLVYNGLLIFFLSKAEAKQATGEM